MQIEDMMRLRSRYPWSWVFLHAWQASTLSMEELCATEKEFGRSIGRDEKIEIWVKSSSSIYGGTERVTRVKVTRKATLAELLYDSPAARSDSVQFVAVVQRFPRGKFTKVRIFRSPKDKKRYPKYSHFIMAMGQGGLLSIPA
jgi:hypothetical protein